MNLAHVHTNLGGGKKLKGGGVATVVFFYGFRISEFFFFSSFGCVF